MKEDINNCSKTEWLDDLDRPAQLAGGHNKQLNTKYNY